MLWITNYVMLLATLGTQSQRMLVQHTVTQFDLVPALTQGFPPVHTCLKAVVAPLLVRGVTQCQCMAHGA